MTPSERALPRLSLRDADAIIALALDLEQRANRLKERDPEAYRSSRLDDLHNAARLAGDAGRRLRTAIREERRRP